VPSSPHPNREQRLDDAVVELLGDPLAILEQCEPLVGPMKAHVLDRRPGLDGKDDESFLIVLDGAGLVNNLVAATIGNVIGGALLVGLVYWFVYVRPTRPA
jgi:hypothetical protein